MCQLDRLQRLKTEISQIAQKHNAGRVYVFGSCARREETSESDIDFVADFKEHTTLFDHAALEYDLAQFLGCKVDVVSLRRLRKKDSFSQNVMKDMMELC